MHKQNSLDDVCLADDVADPEVAVVDGHPVHRARDDVLALVCTPAAAAAAAGSRVSQRSRSKQLERTSADRTINAHRKKAESTGGGIKLGYAKHSW
jgi:hypothetical protein